MNTKVDENWWKWNFANLFNEVVNAIFHIWYRMGFPGTEIDVFFKIVLFNIVFFGFSEVVDAIFSRLILNGIFPGTEIGVFFEIVLFNIVFFNVASTKSSNIAGILSPAVSANVWLNLGLISWLVFSRFPWLVFSRFGWHSSRLRVCAVVAFLWVPQQFLMLSVLPKVSSLSFRIR